MSEGARKPSSRKLLGAESSTTRSALMDATEQLMQEEGYGAVTSRRIAEKAGLKHQLIYYYFDTLDDLFLAVMRRGAEQNLEMLTAALASDRPLRAMWDVIRDPRVTLITAEFMALASRHAVIRAEITRYAEQFRRMQADALERRLAARGMEPKTSPLLVTMLMYSLSSVVVREASLGISLGHAEAEAYIELCLRQFEETGDAPAAPAALPPPAP